MRGGGAIGGEPRDGLADLAEAEDADANGSDLARPLPAFARGRARASAFDGFGESSVGNDASHLSPISGRELAPAAHLPAEASAGKRPGCCGIFGPGPSATLDKTSCRRGGKTESMYFD